MEANAWSRSADLIQSLSGGNSTTRTTVPRLGGASCTGALHGSLEELLSAGIESVVQISVTPKVGIPRSVITWGDDASETITERPPASCPVTIRRIFLSGGLRVWLRAGVVFFICRIPIAICASVPMRRRLGASATAIEYSSDPQSSALKVSRRPLA